MIDEKNMTFDDRTQPGDRLIPLQARYSCRSFSDQEIPEELLNQVIAAGLNAPTGGNLQPYTVLVIRNPRRRRYWRSYAVRALSAEQPSICCLFLIGTGWLSMRRQSMRPSWLRSPFSRT